MPMPLEMHEYTWVQLLKDNPEWATLATTILFAIITTIVIIRQVCVMQAQTRIMKWQATNSVRHEHQQNRLLERQNKLVRFQFEFGWIRETNTERERLLTLVRRLAFSAECLAGQGPVRFAEAREASAAEKLNWQQLRERAIELSSRLQILDVAIVSGERDREWYKPLTQYVTATLTLIEDDFHFKSTFNMKETAPGLSAINSIKGTLTTFQPNKIALNLEDAIRSEFLAFKQRWDTETR